ncbi:MAG: metal ABC transporter solute-binding protein, Zn/Mn family [Desulfatibacillaceae bacterium]
MNIRILSTCLAMLCIVAAASPALAADPLRVFVSIVPQRFFVKNIAGPSVEVDVMVRPGENPATYEPAPGQMAALDGAAAYFSVGVPFERAWLPRITSANPDMEVIDTTAGIEKKPMDSHDHEGGDHGHAHGKEGIPDPHVWLSPPLAKIMAENIGRGLARLDPENAGRYEANLADLLTRIDELHKDLSTTLSGLESRHFMVFHPSWGYFADTYGLVQVPVEVEGKDPKPARLAGLIKKARNLDISTIFVQPQFSRRNAEVIASAVGAEMAVADPLAADWEANLREVAEKLRSAAR